MKLRIILIVLSLLAFLSASTGGYLYYSSLKESALKEAERQADLRLRTIKKNLTIFLAENVKPVKTLAGMETLQLALSKPDAHNLAAAYATLDHFKKTLAADVCYLNQVPIWPWAPPQVNVAPITAIRYLRKSGIPQWASWLSKPRSS